MSATVLPLSANEFASCERASADSPFGPVFTEKQNNENRRDNNSFNENDDKNALIARFKIQVSRFKILYIL